MKKDANWLSKRLAGYIYSSDVNDKFKYMWGIFEGFEDLGLVVLDEWVERRVRSWCENDLVVWWGASSCGKTRVGGMLALLDWMAGHWCTNTVVVSTTREMLAQRIWGEISWLWSKLSMMGLSVGELVPSDMVIRYQRGDERNVLRGVAILRGNRQEALSNLLGVHNERNVMCVDEMQGSRDVVIDAIGNRYKSGRFKFLGMGNPTTRDDPLGMVSEPVGGWKKLDMGVKSWVSKMDMRVEWFDGRESPGVRDAKRYGHLLTADDIEKRRRVFGEGSLIWWSQVIGFMPPEGVGGRMFDMISLEGSGALSEQGEDEVFSGDVIRVGGLDPAYSSGGDRAVLVWADIGRVRSGRYLIVYRGHKLLETLTDDRGGEPLTIRLKEEAVRECRVLGILGSNLAVDTTGVQVVFGDMLSEALGGIYKVNFGGEAKGVYKSGEDAKKIYANRVSQVWGLLNEYVSVGMIRGMKKECATELCARRLEVGGKIKLETKDEMKKRVGYSPDVADAYAMVAVLAKERLGIEVDDGNVIRRGREREFFNVKIKEGEYDEREEDVIGAVEGQDAYAAGWVGMAGQGYEDIIT